MPEANAQIGRVFQPSDAPSARMAELENAKNFSSRLDPNLLREPDYYVYVYTVSPREFIVERPPHLKRLIVRACPRGEKYAMVTRIAHPFQQPDYDGNGELIARSHDARKVAMDICNPSNITLDQDAQIDMTYAEGTNLTRQGIFWSLHNPPTDEEVNAAIARKETYYRGLLERARALEHVNPRELELTLTPDYHAAADYFNVETSWHKTMVRPDACPHCGDPVRPGVAFHKNAMDTICVLDWRRAVDAGVKTKADVPESQRWWKEAPRNEKAAG